MKSAHEFENFNEFLKIHRFENKNIMTKTDDKTGKKKKTRKTQLEGKKKCPRTSNELSELVTVGRSKPGAPVFESYFSEIFSEGYIKNK